MTTNGDSLQSVNSPMSLSSNEFENHAVTTRPHWILGDVYGRRVADYRHTAKRCGHQEPQCVGWDEVINGGIGVLNQIPLNTRLRIDSFGERLEVIQSLIRHGGGESFPARGEIRGLNFQFSGISRVLHMLNSWSQTRVDIRWDQKPQDIEVMFDKWATHLRMIPHRPETILLPTTTKELDGALEPFLEKCDGRIFLKTRCGSSASGVCFYRVTNSRQQLIAPIEIERTSDRVRLFNSLRVRSYTSPNDIRDIFRVLVPQGMIAEAAVNKARVDGDRFDLRIVVINQQAEHIVVRQSPSPITNLHLGNQRGSLEAVVDSVGNHRLVECRCLAIHAASCFPNTRYCGVDILLPKSGNPLVCEVNAFGDFLPNLTANGKTVYEAVLNCDRNDSLMQKVGTC